MALWTRLEPFGSEIMRTYLGELKECRPEMYRMYQGYVGRILNKSIREIGPHTCSFPWGNLSQWQFMKQNYALLADFLPIFRVTIGRSDSLLFAESSRIAAVDSSFFCQNIWKPRVIKKICRFLEKVATTKI